MANKMGRRITEEPTVKGVLPKSRGDANQEISADGAPDHRATGASGAGAVWRSPRGEEDSGCDQKRPSSMKSFRSATPSARAYALAAVGFQQTLSSATPITAWVVLWSQLTANEQSTNPV
jgi:hypothetical protein